MRDSSSERLNLGVEMAVRFRLDAAEQEELEDALAAALEWVLDATGADDTGPLFLHETQGVRERFFQPDDTPEVPQLPEHLHALRPPTRSKHACYAAWRVMVRFVRSRARVDPDFRRAMDAIHFSWFGNRPPYRWSGKKPPPNTNVELSAHMLADWASMGCWQTIEDLRRQRRIRERRGTVRAEAEAELIVSATRPTLKGPLKLGVSKRWVDEGRWWQQEERRGD